jgi:4-amino-4-deoxy-L-arabinose transferase-like glycosyltransferase
LPTCRSDALTIWRFWTLVGAAAAVGLIARVYYVLGVVRGRIALSGDAETYFLLGNRLAEGRGYIRPRESLQAALDIPTAEFPPAYPLLLGALDFVGVDSVTGQRLFGALIGVVTIIIIGLLGSAVAGRTVGVVAAWIAALYPQLITFDGTLMSEGLFAALVAASLLGVVRAMDPAEVAPTKWWVLASVATGIGILTRTEALLLLPLLLIPATFLARDRSAGLADWTRSAVLVCAGSATTLTLWTIRNARALGRFQPFTNNSGTALAGANCDAVYQGTQIGGWRLDCVPSYDSSVTAESTFAHEARQAGVQYITAHLSDLPRVMAARLARTFGLWDMRTSLFFEGLEGRDYDWLWAGWVAWLLIAGLAAIGVVTLRSRDVRIWPLLMPLAIVAFMSAITYGNQRFRVAAEPGIVVLAAVGLVRCARHIATTTATRQRQLPDGSS